MPFVNCNAQETLYTYNDVIGIWEYNQNTVYNESPSSNWNNEYYIFKKSMMLCISTSSSEICDFCDYKKQIGVCEFGFTNTSANCDIDSIYDCGIYLTFKENNGDYSSWCCFLVTPMLQLEFFYHECSYLENLPKKAQIVLYENSQKYHRNYAREFLNYDICGIKTEGCQLLDSLMNQTGIVISKDEIVVVRDTCGDLLQVEYEPELDKFVSGYLRREDLQFVEIEN